MKLLNIYAMGMGMKVIPVPQKFALEKIQKYNVGLLKEIVEYLIELPTGNAIEVYDISLTNSNVSTMHSNAKKLGYRLHCFHNGDKKVLYVEKR